MIDIVIRPADLESDRDAEAIVVLLDRYAQHPMGQGRPLGDRVRGELIPGLRRHPTTQVLLAWDGDQPVGLAICFLGFSSFRAAPLLNIHDLFIDESVRGRGLGRQLLAAVDEHARRLGCAKVTLEVRSDNTNACHLYRSVGYTPNTPEGVESFFWYKDLD